MEYISNKYKKIKFKFKFKKIKVTAIFLSLIAIFLTGIWWERYEYDRIVNNFLKDFVDTAASRLYSNFSEQEKMVIDINYRNYQKLLDSRKLSINNYRATESLQEWVPARITFNNKEYSVKVKLKGTHKDHWEHPNKWSFKVKVRNGKTLLNVREFSIQHPKTRGYLYEWLFMQALKKEKLISHRVNFYEVIVNGNSLGIYNFEEQHSKELLENNGRRAAPIIGFDKNLWIEEANNIQNLSVNSLNDSFWRAKISAVNLAKIEAGSEQELYLKNAIYLLESFRNDSLSINEVFDTGQMAKLMALKALFGSVEFDWRDIKFYYNPITSLLEPIGREVHSERLPAQTWWIDSSVTGLSHSVDQKYFLELLYKDKKFYKKYLSELYRVTEPNYLNELIKDNNKQFSINKKILKKNYPSSDLFSKNNIEFYRKQIRDTLNPVQGVNVYFLNYEDNVLSLNVGNLQRLPVEISGLMFDDLSKSMIKDNIIINGKKPGMPVDHTTIRLKCLSEIKCNKASIKNQRLIYNIIGQDKEKESVISFWNNLDNDFIFQQTFKYKTNLEKKSYIEIKENKKEILIKKGNWDLSEKLIFPQGYKVVIGPGTIINLDNEGQIISYSPVYFNGSKNEPIIIKSTYEGEIQKIRELAKTTSNTSLGYGILVVNADAVSKISNVIFKRLSSPPLKSGQGLVGAINFYESDVKINDTIFLENIRGDDYLNIIRSNFTIKNSLFSNIYKDAFDSDFSKGVIENVSFEKVNNDAMDFSGSRVEGKKIYMYGVGDKGVSAGEKSTIKLNNIVVEDSNLAFASKDLSKLIISNGSLSRNKIAAAAYNKKTEYGPGKIELFDTKLNNNSKSYLVEKNSSIQVDGVEISISEINFNKYNISK